MFRLSNVFEAVQNSFFFINLILQSYEINFKKCRMSEKNYKKSTKKKEDGDSLGVPSSFVL
jgi:hypothetical protein